MKTKILVIALLTLLSHTARAETPLHNYFYSFHAGEKCINAGELDLFVTGNLGNGIYETHGNPEFGAKTVLLKIKKGMFHGRAPVGHVPVRYVGTEQMKANNGFMVNVEVVEQCI